LKVITTVSTREFFEPRPARQHSAKGGKIRLKTGATKKPLPARKVGGGTPTTCVVSVPASEPPRGQRAV